MAPKLETNLSLSLNEPAQLRKRPFRSLVRKVIATPLANCARARTKSCGAIAPPSGEVGSLVGRAVRAREKEGPQLVSGAGPGQESARTALLR